MSRVSVSPEKRNVIVCLLLAVVTLAVYNPVNKHPFVNYDDDRYVTENVHVRQGLTAETIRWAFTSSEQANWHPLTWLTHMFDCQFWGMLPSQLKGTGGHHLTNVVFHLGSVLLFRGDSYTKNGSIGTLGGPP